VAYIDQSKRVDWLTPQHVLTDWVYPILGRVSLDPCGNPKSIVEADHHCYGEDQGDDGMALPWHKIGSGTVFLNCTYGERRPKADDRPHVPKLPYFHAVSAWVQKCADESQLGAHIVGLLPASTDRKWFQNIVARSASFCLLARRLKFRLPEMGPTDSSQPGNANLIALWSSHTDKHTRFKELLVAHGYVHERKP
jgi:hypothetical protein